MRPENPYKRDNYLGRPDTMRHIAFEAGADAMLEAVIEIVASALSDNDVRPRADEIFTLFRSQIVGWLIERRRKLQGAKRQQHQLEPQDTQSAMLYGAKARALQEVINYLNSLLGVDK